MEQRHDDVRWPHRDVFIYFNILNIFRAITIKEMLSILKSNHNLIHDYNILTL